MNPHNMTMRAFFVTLSVVQDGQETKLSFPADSFRVEIQQQDFGRMADTLHITGDQVTDPQEFVSEVEWFMDTPTNREIRVGAYVQLDQGVDWEYDRHMPGLIFTSFADREDS